VIGKRLGISGRTLDRYLRILDNTPLEVQNAVEAGTLPVTLAEKVAGLAKSHREQINQEIREGGDPKVVVRRTLGTAPRKTKNANDVKDLFVRGVERAVTGLDGRLEEVRWANVREEATLEKGRTLICQLLERAEELRKDQSLDDPAGDGEDGSAGEEVANGTAALSIPSANMAGRKNRLKRR
jgi:hypothetical protein